MPALLLNGLPWLNKVTYRWFKHILVAKINFAINSKMKYQYICVLELSPISLGFNPTSFQSSPGLSFETKCKTFLVKMSFISMRIKKIILN